MTPAQLLGQALLGVATLLFVGGAAAMVTGYVAVDAMMPVSVAAVACLGLGVGLARPGL
ncbi:MAG: hypothetical protein ABEJ82_07520 [Haloplanus sp.]